MIRQVISFTFSIVICTIMASIVSSWILNASYRTKSSITIVATVQPGRFIVVDRNLEIRTVVSNTKEDVRPIVYLESIDGKEIPYSESVVESYQTLKTSLDFSRPGIVYERKNHHIKNIWEKIQRWLQGKKNV